MLAEMGDEGIENLQPEVLPEILNSRSDFVRLAASEVRDRFVGMPAKVLLSEGETLYRFFPNELDAPDEFWLPLETYHHLRGAPEIPDWAVWRKAHSRMPATKFSKATLRKKVYGFRGCVRGAGSDAVTVANMVSSSILWIPALSEDDFLLRVYWLGAPKPSEPVKNGEGS